MASNSSPQSVNEISFDVVNVNVDISKRQVTTIAGIEVVSGVSIDYSAFLNKVMSKLSHFLTSEGATKEDLAYHLARLGLWLNKSASNKKYMAKFTMPKGQYNITQFSTAMEMSKGSKETSADKMTVNRLRRCLMPYVAKLLKEMKDRSTTMSYVANKFRVLDKVPIEYSFPESYLVVPAELRKEYLEAIVSYELSWTDSSVKGRWSYKAKQFFKDYKPLEIVQDDLLP
jgi:hypothetical protein